MTNIEVIQLALRRVGLSTTSTTFKDGARSYLNMATKDLASRAKWFWLFKESSFTCVSGQRSYSLAADVAEPLSFRNHTQDHVLVMWSSQDLDANDPDHSETGDPRYVSIDGINSSTGYISVALYPKPDNSTDVVKYRYYAFVPDFTSSDDGDSLDPYVHPLLQPALAFGVSALYKQEKGDDQGSMVDKAEMERVIQRGLLQNTVVQGNRSYRMRRRDSMNGGAFDFKPLEGSLS